MASSASYVAVVTGATGFLGLTLVKQLLERGWRVRACLRDVTDAKKREVFERLAAALPGAVSFFEADLLKVGSYHAACRGADFVFHCGSPFFIDAADPQRELVDTAVEGTRNVLLAAAAAGCVKRVVLTSSFAACKGRNAAPPVSGSLYTEADWSDNATVEEGAAYWVGKRDAERLAWALAKEHGLDLVTINPEFIIGPPVAGMLPDPLSVGYMKAWLEGTPSTGPCTFAPDVRDVARAHILAALNPAASGRYIVADSRAVAPRFISDVLRTRFPQFELPEGEEVAAPTTVDASRVVRELGLHLTPLEETLQDMATVLIALGIATPTLKA